MLVGRFWSFLAGFLVESFSQKLSALEDFMDGLVSVSDFLLD